MMKMDASRGIDVPRCGSWIHPRGRRPRCKLAFQVHGVDERGRVVLRGRLGRGKVLAFFANLPRCRIGLEARGARRSAPTSGSRRWQPGAHHWARELTRLGHDARLMPPQYVKACGARRSAPTSGGRRWEPGAGPTPEHALRAGQERNQQATCMLHRVRDQQIGQRTATIPGLGGWALRGHLAEVGIVAAQRQAGLRELMTALGEVENDRIPPRAREVLQTLVAHLGDLAGKLAELDRRLVAMTRSDPICRTLAEVPGIGPVIATAFAATVPAARGFRSGRHLAAWLGLVPRQHGTGGKEHRLGLSKRGDADLRRQLIHGARALVKVSPGRTGKLWSWVNGLRERRPFNVVVAAVANKLARIIWAMLSRGEAYRAA